MLVKLSGVGAILPLRGGGVLLFCPLVEIMRVALLFGWGAATGDRGFNWGWGFGVMF